MMPDTDSDTDSDVLPLTVFRNTNFRHRKAAGRGFSLLGAPPSRLMPHIICIDGHSGSLEEAAESRPGRQAGTISIFHVSAEGAILFCDAPSALLPLYPPIPT